PNLNTLSLPRRSSDLVVPKRPAPEGADPAALKRGRRSWPISKRASSYRTVSFRRSLLSAGKRLTALERRLTDVGMSPPAWARTRSEEHTSELQSLAYL